MLPHALWGTSQGLALAHPHHMVEVLADHSTPGIHLMGCWKSHYHNRLTKRINSSARGCPLIT